MPNRAEANDNYKSGSEFGREPNRIFGRIVYVPFDHLNVSRGALKSANKDTDLIVLVESQRMLKGRRWHPERLFFLVSSARHFAAELAEAGWAVRYVKAPTTIEGLKQVRAEVAAQSGGNAQPDGTAKLPIIAAEPSSFTQFNDLAEYGVEFVENDLFLTTRNDFALWAKTQKTYVMESFYRAQRVRLGILVEGGKPEGGQWNFDHDNRLPPPKNYSWPAPLEHERDDIDQEVAKDLDHDPTNTWATTRADALTQLEHFVLHNLAGFGPYEDSVAADSWALHHSLLSPYLNNGLLHATEVVRAVLVAYSAGNAPIQSVEAFIRQVIGWREYINGMYWFLGPDYRNQNSLGAKRKLLPVFTNSSQTKMNCVSKVVADVEKRAWTHHIPRLMILSNLALITGVNPSEFLDWMRENFVDATEWVMVPNIIGMATYADGGTLMTKPYASGGSYLSRMTSHCKGCAYDPKKRVGDDACPFTTLYWDFLDRHRETFAKNYRMGQQVMGLNRLSDLPELKVRAAEVLSGLEQGLI